jgi:hypothetical protein
MLYREDIDENTKLILTGIGERKATTVVKLAVGLLFAEMDALYFHTTVASALKIRLVSRCAIPSLGLEEA